MSKPADTVLSAYFFISTTTLEKILSVGHNLKDGKPIPSFDENLLIDLFSEAHQIFMKEKCILELEGNFIIAGNINGNLLDLLRILKYSHNTHLKLLFLGDYVGTGGFSLECLSLLFAMKISRPNSVFLIRGDHEFNSVCCEIGFKNEFIENNDPQLQNQSNDESKDQNNEKPVDEHSKSSSAYKYSEKLYNAILKVFSYLPVSAIINNTTFCVHGGLSPKLHRADSILKMVQRPIYYFEDNLLLSDILNSEPTESSRGMFVKNGKSRGYLFNNESLSIFLRDNSLTRLIRSHQFVASGSLKSLNNRCITVYSASSYDRFESVNSAVVELFQKNDGYRISTFFPIRRFYKNDAIFYKVQSFHKIEKKTIPLSISLIKPHGFQSSGPKSETSRELGDQDQPKLKSCVSSRLRMINPLKAQLLSNQKKFSRLPKRPFIHDSFSADFYEDDE